jgi:ABC-type transporter Mla subunit MlaD
MFTALDLNFVFHLMNGKAVPWLLSGGILLLALGMYARFKALLKPVIRDIESATAAVKTYREYGLDFRSLSEEMERLTFLSDGWGSLKKVLIVQKDPLSGKETILMPQDISEHLTEAKIVGPAINLRFYQSLPNMLVGLGLFFTFIGLVMALYFASQGVAAPNVEDAQKALKNLLDAATFKFLTSLAGLLSSLVFSWREKAVLHAVTGKIERLTLDLESAFTRTSLETLAYQRNIELQKHDAVLREQLEEARQQTAQLKRFETDFAVSIANALDSRLSPRFEHLAITLGQAIEQLSLKIGSVNEDALKTMIEDFRKTLTEGAGAEIGKMSEVITKLASTLESTGTGLQEKLQGAGEGISVGAKQLEDVLGNLKTDMVGLEDVVRRAAENAGQTTSLLERNVKDLSSLHDSLGQTLSGLNGVGSTIDETARTLDSSIKGLIHSQETTAEEVHQMLETVKSALTSIDQSGQQVQAISEALESSWASYHGRFESVDEELEKVFDSLRDGLDNYTEKIKSFHGELDKQLGAALQNLGALVQELSDTADELAEARRS